MLLKGGSGRSRWDGGNVMIKELLHMDGQISLKLCARLNPNDRSSNSSDTKHLVLATTRKLRHQ